MESYSAKISGKLAVARSTLAKRASFVDCNDSEQSSLFSAASAASQYAADAISYVSSYTSPTPRYTTWFGDYTTERHDVVQSGFSAISSNDFSSFTYNCSCTDPATFAYVYANE